VRDPVRNLWDAVSSANVRAIADELYPTLTDRTMPVTSLDSCHKTAVRAYAPDPTADVLVAHRDLDPRHVVWVKDEPTCYACGGEATHEIPWRGQWLDVCDDPTCTGHD